MRCGYVEEKQLRQVFELVTNAVSDLGQQLSENTALNLPYNRLVTAEKILTKAVLNTTAPGGNK